MASSEDSSNSIFSAIVKWLLIIVFVLLPLKVVYHPYEERALVVCNTLHSLADFFWIDVAGSVVFLGDPAGKLQTVVKLEDYRKTCIIKLENKKVLNMLPKFD